MSSAHTCLELLLADLLLLGALAPSPARAQTNDDSKTQLPPELHGAKVYHLPEETKLGAPVEDLIIYPVYSDRCMANSDPVNTGLPAFFCYSWRHSIATRNGSLDDPEGVSIGGQVSSSLAALPPLLGQRPGVRVAQLTSPCAGSNGTESAPKEMPASLRG